MNKANRERLEPRVFKDLFDLKEQGAFADHGFKEKPVPTEKREIL